MSPAMIRRLQYEDAPIIIQVLKRARAGSRVSIGPNWSPDQITEECRGEGFVFVGAGGVVSAFILFRDTGVAWEITFLATDPDAQGQGQMTALFERMKADRPPERAIWLEVHGQNTRARRLYEQQGLEIVGERPKYYADGGTAILYSLG